MTTPEQTRQRLAHFGRLLREAFVHAGNRAEREQKNMVIYVGERTYVRSEDEPEPEEFYDRYLIEPEKKS